VIENFFGTVAFITSVVGLFPQIYKAIKTKSTHDLSIVMLINFLVCSIAWIIYGTYSSSLYVQASNIVGMVSCIALIGLKYFYDKRVVKS